MRALLCVKPGDLRVIDRPRPTPGRGEVLIRITRAGVCGTDLHIFEGNQPYLNYPRVIGHELAGVVVETGPDCATPIGQHVYVIPYIACGDCVACRRGKTNCCQRIGVLGVHIDGGMADFICAPERNIAAADGVTPDQAAMVEFLAIGAHAVRRANFTKGDRALIVGAGPIGVGCILFARNRGAAVTVLDVRRDRLDFCRDMLGVANVIEASGDVTKTLAEQTNGDFFDVVIDATGAAKAMMAGFRYVAHGGTYVFVGVVRDTIAFEDPEFHKREMTLVASRNATPEDFDEVFRAMREGLIPTDSLITHRATLEEAASLFPIWMKPETAVIKALIDIEAPGRTRAPEA
jgi:2-desacetyl-2-hydroxyethyl bacteriochlorophyllide A dehydrogenase